MPNRQMREGFLDSEAIDALTPEAECFYHRLLLVCDDAGRCDGRPPLLAARCWPLRRDKRASDVESWVHLCADKALLIPYEFCRKPYIQVTKVAKSGNSKASKFPWKDGSYKMEFVMLPSRDGEEGERWFVSTSVPNMDAIHIPSVPHPPPISTVIYGNENGNVDEYENEPPDEKSGDTSGEPTLACRIIPPPMDMLLAHGQRIMLSAEECHKFYDHFESVGWKVGGRSAMRDWQAALRKWKSNTGSFANSSHAKPKHTPASEWKNKPYTPG